MKKRINFFPAIIIVLYISFTGQLQAQVGNNDQVLNPNRAGLEDLTSVPGISEEIAKNILAERPFLRMSEFNSFLKKSLSADAIKEVYVKLFVPINLNTASEDEILMVPGVGNRMAHEFDEYRPYTALAQFRREIGKYVDENQVAKYEQYVFVPVNLNTASDEAILSIPGVGNRMLREFKEYRPYKNIQQFRREIGKYADDKEVARLERYVTLDKDN